MREAAERQPRSQHPETQTMPRHGPKESKKQRFCHSASGIERRLRNLSYSICCCCLASFRAIALRGVEQNDQPPDASRLRTHVRHGINSWRPRASIASLSKKESHVLVTNLVVFGAALRSACSLRAQQLRTHGDSFRNSRQLWRGWMTWHARNKSVRCLSCD